MSDGETKRGQGSSSKESGGLIYGISIGGGAKPRPQRSLGPTMKRIKTKEIANPCSGRYGGDVGGTNVEIMVDIDDTREFSKALNVVSGTITPEALEWSVNAASVHFCSVPLKFEVSFGKSSTRSVNSEIKVDFSDGTKATGSMDLMLSFDQKTGTWEADLDLNIRGVKKLSYKKIERKSLFFREVSLVMEYTDAPMWPTVELRHLADVPAGMKDRKIDPVIAFEDAGIKLRRHANRKVDDPSPGTPWTKSDFYEAMREFFNKSESSDVDIWCMVGTTPPDKRWLGFSVKEKVRAGFGLFTSHSSFKNLEDAHEGKKAIAQRRFLHYLMNECGHCLGLKHSFRNGTPNSLSWMNYAWKYDDKYGVRSFYRDFKFSFSDKELLVLRHCPSKTFQEMSSPDVVALITQDGYEPKTEAPDNHLADDEDDNDPESYDPLNMEVTEKPRPLRKIALDLKLQKQYSMSQVFSFETRIKNKGKLPALIEGDLSVSSNLLLYISKDGEGYKTVNPFVRPIYSGYNKTKVLYTPEDEEGPDRYSQQVSVGVGPEGYVFDKPGKYEIRAVYNGGRYTTSSETYKVTIVSDEEDAETSEEVLTAAILQSSNSNRFHKAIDFWKKLKLKGVDKRKSHTATVVALLQGMAEENNRLAASSHGTPYQRGKAALGGEQLLKDTDDLLAYYHKEGGKEDNLDYSNLVLARGKLYVTLNRTEDGTKEFDQLIGDVLNRGVKYDVVMRLHKKRQKVTNPARVEDRYTTENLQRKVESVLHWVPSTNENGEPEITGIGLGRPFRNFGRDATEKGFKVINMLFRKYEETQDLYATIDYADKLQKAREVNFRALQWALEAFIVHSQDAKKAGIRYPEPRYKEEPLVLKAAVDRTIREGTPQEQWMNYWRCDADLNYHHSHWHIVYILGNELDKRGNLDLVDPYLRREGEVFGYMHSQMVARCNADRESWGMPPVTTWEYDEKAAPFNAGREFQDDPRFQKQKFVPRPEAAWPENVKEKFRNWESRYKTSVETGFFLDRDGNEIELTPNWAGRLLEPSAEIFTDHYDYIHNQGHDTFGTVGIRDGYHSYMASTVTSARDFIFYRWHKRIDDLYQMNNDKYVIDITEDAPPVTITADDIILTSDPNPPKDFGSFKGGWVTKAPQEVAHLKTMLGPPIKMYELDNKLDHEKFYYHLRIKRNSNDGRKVAIPLTIRIFICPKKRQADRKHWIEMDKFVCKIEEKQDFVMFTRKDVHSSVIKRDPKDMEDSIENKYTKEVGGFCECGWPYSMLLPRGKKDGEEYVVLVMATDNSRDKINIRTHCGSMSYCGSRDQAYPDVRTMGYPFAHPIHIDDKLVPIPEAFDRISNAAYKTFVIQNDAAEPPPIKAVDIWWPKFQVNRRRADDPNHDVSPIFEYKKSKLTGHFYVLIDEEAASAPIRKNIMIRFMGRGRNGGCYQIRDVTIFQTRAAVSAVKIAYKGRENFSVPEFGLISDPLRFDCDRAKGDLYISFTTDTPGAYLDAPTGATMTSTIHEVGGVQHRYPYVQCISGIMSSLEE